MIPVLYETTETAFTSNGLGRLSDAMSCRVEEERNGAYELTLEYPITGIHFEDIRHSRIIAAVPADGKGAQPFRIYYIGKPMSGTVEVKAEHISYQLTHIPVNPFTAGNCSEAMSRLKTYSAETNPFTFWTDKTTVANFEVKIPSSIRSLLGGTQGSVLDVYGGGEYEFDKYTVKLYNSRGLDNNVKLKYGKNITDIKQEENISTTYTGVYPYWLGSVDNVETLVALPEKVLHSSNAQYFPYQRTIPLDLSSEFQTAPTESQLRTRAQAYMATNNIGVPKVSIDVNFIALWQTEEYKQFANLERVNLCDLVTVEFPLLGISAKAKVVKTDYDVLNERYNSIEVGDARTNLATQITQTTNEAVNALAQMVPTKTFLQQAIDHATQLITGGLGGYVTYTFNADGEPQEILIMNTDNIQTATKVIRINQNGIGFSNNGYSGPFTTAWTIDGHFNASFIDTGSLSAALIQTGYLSANRIQGGTLIMGGANNGNGIISIKDGSGNTIGTIDNTGANITGNITMKSANGVVNSGLRSANIIRWYMSGSSLQTEGTTGLDLRWTLSNSFRVIDAEKEFMFHTDDSSNTEISALNSGTFHKLHCYRKTSKYYMYNERFGEAYTFTIYPLTASRTLDLNTNDSTRASISGHLGRLVLSEAGIGWTLNNLTSGSTEDTIKSIVFDFSNQQTGLFSFILKPDVFKVMASNTIFRMASGSATINGNTIQVSSNSSKRYKKDIADLEDDKLDPHRLLELKPKQFVYKDDALLQYKDMKGQTLPGFIAEDVEEIYPSAVIHKDGEVESWDERRLIPGMLALIQEQQKAIDELKKQVNSLEALLKAR